MSSAMSTAAIPPAILQQHANAVYITAGVLLALAWMVVSLRVYVRALMIKSFGVDDALMVVAAVVYTGYCASVILTTDATTDVFGSTRALTLPALHLLINYLIASIALYIVTMIVFKIALGMFFLRIVIRPWQRYVVYGTIAVNTIYGVGFLFFEIFQCGNPKYFLEKELTGKCVSNEVLLGVNLSHGILNAVTDWILCILPIFVLRKAKLPRVAKISAGFVLLVGNIGSVCSIIRLLFVKGFTPGAGFFLTSINFTIWSMAECGVGIIAASLATLRPLFHCCMENARNLTTPGLSSHAKSSRTAESSQNTWVSAGRPNYNELEDFCSCNEVKMIAGNNVTFLGNLKGSDKGVVTQGAARKPSVRGYSSERTRPHVIQQVDGRYVVRPKGWEPGMV